MGQELGQPSPNEKELQEIPKKEDRAGGTVYWTQHAIGVTDKQMVCKPMLSSDATGETTQLDLHELTPFASRSMVPPTPTLQPKGQADCNAKGDHPPASGSQPNVPRRGQIIVLEGHFS